jgi:hypothetical protein
MSKSNNVPQNIKMIRPELAEVVEFTKALELPASDGRFCYCKWMENDWPNGKQPIRNWQLTIRSWKAASYLPSQKTSGASPLMPSTSWPSSLSPHP